jgi:enoyl-CoA hydratase/carnithine racemase
VASSSSSVTWSGYTTLLVKQDDGVLDVALNRPDKLNSFTKTMIAELEVLWTSVRLDDSVRVIVLTGSGRAFSSGVDRTESVVATPNVWNREDPGRRIGPKSNRCWKPVICAVNGLAAGGAFYFINEAEIVICSHEATFFDPHVTYGMVAACEPIGALARMPYAEIMRMVLLGSHERIGAARALQLGLVSDVTAADDLLAEARRLASIVASAPAPAVQGSVRAVWNAVHSVWAAGLEHAIQYPTVGNDPAGRDSGLEQLNSAPRPAVRIR